MARKDAALVPTQAIAGAIATVYTAPAAGSGVATMLNIHVQNNHSTTQTFYITAGADDSGHDVFGNAANPISLNAGQSWDWYGPMTLAAGATVKAEASDADVSLTISGTIDY